jgi:hypothetical protein
MRLVTLDQVHENITPMKHGTDELMAILQKSNRDPLKAMIQKQSVIEYTPKLTIRIANYSS